MRPCSEVFGLMLLIRLRWDQPIERPVPGVQRLSEERWLGSCQTSLNFTPKRYYRFIYYYASFIITLRLLLRLNVLQTEHLEQATKLDFRQRSVISAASWTKKNEAYEMVELVLS